MKLKIKLKRGHYYLVQHPDLVYKRKQFDFAFRKYRCEFAVVKYVTGTWFKPIFKLWGDDTSDTYTENQKAIDMLHSGNGWSKYVWTLIDNTEAQRIMFAHKL